MFSVHACRNPLVCHSAWKGGDILFCNLRGSWFWSHVHSFCDLDSDICIRWPQLSSGESVNQEKNCDELRTPIKDWCPQCFQSSIYFGDLWGTDSTNKWLHKHIESYSYRIRGPIIQLLGLVIAWFFRGIKRPTPRGTDTIWHPCFWSPQFFTQLNDVTIPGVTSTSSVLEFMEEPWEIDRKAL